MIFGTKTLQAATTVSEKMIKVNHAGENGAVNIYRAQRLAASLRVPSLLPQLTNFQKHEEEHRRIFCEHLRDKNIRPCFGYHVCGIGGFTLGFVTGLIGPSAIAATTYAVEHVVLEHLEQQMGFLKNNDQAAFECVNKIYADEKAHHDTAEHQINSDGILTQTLITIVKFSTEQVIRFGMR